MSDEYDGVQPLPVPNDGPSMHDLVVQDIQDRKAFGLKKYNSLLQAHNGRDALQDAYEEALDLVVYLRQLIAERASNVDATSQTDEHIYDIQPGDHVRRAGWCDTCGGTGRLDVAHIDLFASRAVPNAAVEAALAIWHERATSQTYDGPRDHVKALLTAALPHIFTSATEDKRHPHCVEQWPECHSGGYDPRCCRFPKSCSATI